ncbi:MAG: phosphotransferase family protein [Acidimicrobiia bacterium]
MTVAAPEGTRGELQRWLADQLAADVAISSFERPPGGRSNDTFLFAVSWTEAATRIDARWVLRLQPMTTPIFRTPDVVREGRVLQGLEASSAVPVPHVRWIVADPHVLGAPFFVMDEVPGRVPLARPSIHAAGWLPTLSRTELDTLWRSALETVVAVHAVDWRSSHAFLIEASASTDAASHVDRIADWYEWTTAGREYPITDAALEDIQRRTRSGAGAGSPAALVWGDARVGNMIFGPDHKVVAAIDWETATIGPPEIDVAHWLFFDDFATIACGVEPLPGWPDRSEVVSTYESLAGRTLRDLDLFETLEALFIATTLIRQSDARVARGLSPETTRMGHDNAVTQMLARRLGLPVPELSPDYLAHRGAS